MTYKDPTPRILAAGSVVAGLAYVMLEPVPSVTGVLVGLGSMVVSAGFAAVPQGKPSPAKKAVAQSRPETRDAPVAMRREQPDRSPRAQPERAPRVKTVDSSSRLPKVPTHRRRIRERQASDQY